MYTVDTPQKISDNAVYQTVYGYYNNYFIEKNGLLGSTGDMSTGMLANATPIGSSKKFASEMGEIYYPLPNEKITRIYTSDNGIIAINSKDELFTWGEYMDSLPQNSIVGQINTPRKFMNDVKSAAVGENSGYAIKNDNTLWSWGDTVMRAFTSFRN